MNVSELDPGTAIIVHLVELTPATITIWMSGSGPDQIWQAPGQPSLRNVAIQKWFDEGLAIIEPNPRKTDHTITQRPGKVEGRPLWWRCTCGLKSLNAPDV